jgi:repressor LexA
MKELTDRQHGILEFIREYAGERGYPPTLREIGEQFGISWPAARSHLKALAQKGMLVLSEGRSRGIELPEGIPQPGTRALPLVGTVRAGAPVLAVENIEAHIAVDKSLFKDDDAFVLRVTGDSMIEEGIFEGDYVIIAPSREIPQGGIGVALIGDEATVKKVVPANPRLEPRTYQPWEVSLLGRVTGVIRKL